MKSTDNESLLREISTIALNTALKLNFVITPDVYKKVFAEVCQNQGIDITQFNDKLDEVINESILEIDKILKDTKVNFLTLQDTTSRAKIAIHNRDEVAIGNLQNEIDELQNKLSKLERELYTDTLTSVYNRKWLMDKVLDSKESFQTEGFLIIVDLDKFKHINDTYGHIVGDKTLIFIAHNLQANLSPAKTIRYAGDEFFVIGNVNEMEITQRKIKELRNKLDSQKLFTRGHKFTISFSYGLEVFRLGDTFKSIVEKADENMYLDKKHRKS